MPLLSIFFQRQHGCHKCGNLDCWGESPSCPFSGCERLPIADAQLGNNAPHIRQTAIEIYCNGGLLESTGTRMPSNWWKKQHVEISGDGNWYTPGRASGDGCNCLIDTLRQQLKIFANINLVREVLEQKFQDGPAKIKPWDYFGIVLSLERRGEFVLVFQSVWFANQFLQWSFLV